MKFEPQQTHSLSPILSVLEAQGKVLAKARHAYLLKEAERRHHEATLIKASEGKSTAEKTISAQATKEWLVFHQELARTESLYEFQRLKYSVLEKEFQAIYLELKIDSESIKRQV